MKREPMGSDREQDSWLGNTLRRSPATASDACLDAETLAAWADGGLSAKAAVAVEMHASNCSRCMAALATLERTAPAPSATHAWTPARLFRWAAPLAAAATAVAILVVVPDRPITPVSSPARELQATRERADTSAKADADSAAQVPVPVPIPVPVPVPVPERGTPNAVPGTRSPEPQEQYLLRDEARLERVAPEALGAAATAAPEAPPPAPPPAAAPSSAAQSAGARSAAVPPPATTDSLAETATMAARQSNFASKIVVTSESTAPSNPLFRWRVVGSTSIERSTDGAKTWTKTIPLPRDSVKGLTIVGIQASDDVRAMVRMSDGSQYFTTNGGMSWMRLQER